MESLNIFINYRSEMGSLQSIKVKSYAEVWESARVWMVGSDWTMQSRDPKYASGYSREKENIHKE